MKKFALALTAAAAVILGSAGFVDAYPPGGETVVVEDATVQPGGPVTVSANCTVGESVSFSLESSSDTSTCAASVNASNNATTALGGTATGTVNAPTTAGTYTGTVTGSISGALGTFTVIVEGVADSGDNGDTTTPGGGLPATGSDGTSTMTMMAGGLLVVGLGLFGVATVRRRQDTAVA